MFSPEGVFPRRLDLIWKIKIDCTRIIVNEHNAPVRLPVPAVASSHTHPHLPLRGRLVLGPSGEGVEADKRRSVSHPSFINSGGTDHHFFEGRYANVEQATFLKGIIVLRKPLEAAFDTEEKTASQALTG